MKRVALYVLHYGKEYLPWSIRSVQDAVDEIIVVYSPVPSFGHNRGSGPCPDTEEELRNAAQRFLTKPLHWYNKTFGSEGQHRDFGLGLALDKGATTMLVVDADEVWPVGAAEATLGAVEQANNARRWLANFTNFWRGFDWVVLDHFKPVRVVDLRHPQGGDAYLSPEQQPAGVLHFGYAQSEAIMAYKWRCHGHQAELRSGWLEQKFLPWRPGCALEDLHPCVNGLWDKAHETPDVVVDQLVNVLSDHPNFVRGLIR